jgi:hypothetical protein
MTRRLVPAAAGAFLLLALSTGCSATPTTDAAPTTVPSASPEPMTTPTPTPAPDPATCETVLTDEEYASLAADGLTLRPDDAFPLGSAMSDLIDDGALHCTWAGEQGDVAVWFAQLAESDDAWGARESELTAAGWIRTDDPMPGTLTAPTDYDANYLPSMVHVDGMTYFVSYAAFFGSVAALT